MHIYQDAHTSKGKKYNPFVLLPIYGNKAKLSDTFEKKSWKGNLVDDNGGTDKYAYQNRRYIVANTHSWIFSTWSF